MLTEEEQQTVSYYNQHAKEWAEKRKKNTEPSFWDAELRELKALEVPQGTILEMGSGAGREAVELIGMGYEYVGMDVSQELLKIAAQVNPSSQFVYSTAYAMPFATGTFNAFFSWAMLPHIPKERLGVVLEELKRVLKHRAIGFLAMREGEGYHREAETGRWFSYYTQEELELILQQHGFRIEKMGKRPSRPGLVWLTAFVRSP